MKATVSRVYVLIRHLPFVGGQIEGIFLSNDSALKWLEEQVQNGEWCAFDAKYNTEIKEWDVKGGKYVTLR